jgi:2-polyprenyl-6-methoxyphenol hydroxylase-like FAD-dependent oxidoreductase
VHEVLAAELSRVSVPIRLGTTVLVLTQHDDGVDVTFTDGTRERYDLVIGADGSNSSIREMTFGLKDGPRYTGQMNWRATVSRPPEVTGRFSYFGPTIKSGFNPVSKQEIYIYLLQNMPARPRWQDHELPGILRGLLAEFGGILGRARRDTRSEANYLPAGLFHDHAAALVPRTRRADRRCCAYSGAAACERRQYRHRGSSTLRIVRGSRARCIHASTL